MNERAGMQPIGKWRGYFAPVNRTTGAVTRLDLNAGFDLEAPPAPWVELGWIQGVDRSGSVELERVSTGTSGMDTLRFRKRCESKVEIKFCEWGKLQMALASSSQQLNILSGDAYLLLNRDASNLELASDVVGEFEVGDLVAVDVDLDMQVGFVGTGVSCAYVKDASVFGADYIRATTFNVGTVKEKTANALVLTSPLIGGVPAVGARVQKVAGFADREGGSFVQEWSGLFILDEVSGGRVMLWYPRLQTDTESGEKKELICDGAERLSLRATFAAMPIVDAIDGETIVSYRYYVPTKAAPIY